MATYNKINFATDQLAVALTVGTVYATSTTLGTITPIAYTNLSTTWLTTGNSSQTNGTYGLTLTDLVLTASGAVATFQYVTVYDVTSATKPLICWYDYGTPVALATGETFTIDFGATLFTLA
jgi:hypothetical protein